MEKYYKPIITDKKDAFPETVVSIMMPARLILRGDTDLKPERPLVINRKK